MYDEGLPLKVVRTPFGYIRKKMRTAASEALEDSSHGQLFPIFGGKGGVVKNDMDK